MVPALANRKVPDIHRTSRGASSTGNRSVSGSASVRSSPVPFFCAAAGSCVVAIGSPSRSEWPSPDVPPHPAAPMPAMMITPVSTAAALVNTLLTGRRPPA